jgi:8-oxo-dGTP pyrophosphatase MutT (NUDIX family)
VKTPRGFLFEKSPKGYIYTVGGKVKLNESSHEAMKREIIEELGVGANEMTLRSVLENFYTTATEKVHEICFVYEIDEEFNGTVPAEFIEVSINEINAYEIKPIQIVDILKSDKNSFKHIIVK